MNDKAHGRVLDLNLHLLDRQVVDRDGKMVCKVDDVEFEDGENGSLYLSKILIGPRALGRRVGGRPGVWMRAIAQRLSTAPTPEIDFSVVDDIGSAIKLAASRDSLDVAPFEYWVRDHIIARIPGSRHESE